MIRPARNEEIENIKEKMEKYIEFYKLTKKSLEKINKDVMNFDKKVYNKKFREFLWNAGSDDISIYLDENEHLRISLVNNYHISHAIYFKDFRYTPDEGTMERINGEAVKNIIEKDIEELEKSIKQMTREKNRIEKIIEAIYKLHEKLEETGKSLHYTTRNIISNEMRFTLIYGNFSKY